MNCLLDMITKGKYTGHYIQGPLKLLLQTLFFISGSMCSDLHTRHPKFTVSPHDHLAGIRGMTKISRN